MRIVPWLWRLGQVRNSRVWQDKSVVNIVDTAGAVRFHGVRSVESSDTVQSLTAQRRLHASLTTVLSYDYKARQIVAGSSPTRLVQGKLAALESFERSCSITRCGMGWITGTRRGP